GLPIDRQTLRSVNPQSAIRNPQLGGGPLYDPLVIGPCNFVAAQEQEVSSQVEGTLREVLADLGQQVRAGQVLARLDERLLQPQVELLHIKAASDASCLSAQAQLDDIEAKIQVAQRLLARRAFAASELEALLYQRGRARAELTKAREDQETARKELDRARQALEFHQVRSSLAGEVTRVHKRVGESIRQAEPLFWVANCDRLRVEGLCKVQQASLLRAGMRCIVEPELRGEQMTELSGHTGTVAGLAVAPDGRLLASASEDRTVLLWDWPGGGRRAVLPHPAEVHAVAFAPAVGHGRPLGHGLETMPQRGYRLLTGCADGKLRLWSLSAGGKLEGPQILTEGHEGPVRAIAFGPDGRRFATGGEDRRVGVWDAGRGVRVGWLRSGDALDSAHQGAVTWVQFAGPGQLISAGRDNALRVWKLAESVREGEAPAEPLGVFAGRTGDAPQLSVSPDGQLVLFDHGEELRLLDCVDGSTMGSLRGRREGRFSAFALFAPSGRLVLTAGNNGRLQLWTVPPWPEAVSFFRQSYVHGFGRDALLTLGALGQPLLAAAVTTRLATAGPRLWALDGHEVRHFLTPTPAAVTCAAFAPDGTVAFTGGSDRVVRVWPVPPAGQWEQPLEAELTYVGSQVERGTDLVRVRAELENPPDPTRRLRPGTYANLRLYPETR
ncbi:MAG: efflux RND transporter periplasmic adaptor subunit, partial [Gemmataceae bacterium]|nr:efflux RND transporter periplasmic adaptor subunit [Gemmataceae bacterium]